MICVHYIFLCVNFLVIQAMLRGFNIECGCGLKEGEMIGFKKLAENFTLLFISYMIYSNKIRNFEFYPKSPLSK